MPWNKYGKQGVRAGSRWPHLKDAPEDNYLPFPFFLAYATSLLKEKGHEAKLVDAICDDLGEAAFMQVVDDFSPDILVIETSTVTLEDDMRLLPRVKGDFFLVLCGPDDSIQDPKFMERHGIVDFVLKGEYEFTLLDLVTCLVNQGDLSAVSGINYKIISDKKNSASTVFYVNPPRALGDIDTLPWPERDNLQLEKYIDSPGAMPFPTVQMLASRGCPYGCLFCLWPQVIFGGRNYRVRDYHDVLNEMEHVIEKYGFRSVYFDDDTFGLKKEWLHSFCDELIKRRQAGRLKVPWAMMTRPDVLDEELLVKLKNAGLWAIKYGIESGNQKLINQIGKNLDLRYAIKIIKKTHELGIKTHLTFTFGLPGETRATITRTIKTALKLDPYSVQFSITTPFPGTAYYDYVKKEGLLTSTLLADYDGNTKSVIRTKTLAPSKLVAARKRAYLAWNRHVKIRALKKYVLSLPKTFLCACKNLLIVSLTKCERGMLSFVRLIKEMYLCTCQFLREMTAIIKSICRATGVAIIMMKNFLLDRRIFRFMYLFLLTCTYYAYCMMVLMRRRR